MSRRKGPFVVPKEFMHPLGAKITQETGKAAENWSDSEVLLYRVQLPAQYHSVPPDALRAEWVNIRKTGKVPGYKTSGHGARKAKPPELSDEYKRILASSQFKAYFDSLLIMYGNRCAICNVPDSTRHLEPHHRTYKYLGSEAGFDCIPVCRRCHKFCDQRRQSEAEESRQETKALFS